MTSNLVLISFQEQKLLSTPTKSTFCPHVKFHPKLIFDLFTVIKS